MECQASFYGVWTEGFLAAEKACNAQVPLVEAKVERKNGF